jgi:hypothetical protein
MCKEILAPCLYWHRYHAIFIAKALMALALQLGDAACVVIGRSLECIASIIVLARLKLKALC